MSFPRGNHHPNKGKILPQIFFQIYLRKVKRNVERETLLQIAAHKEKSAKKKKYGKTRR